MKKILLAILTIFTISTAQAQTLQTLQTLPVKFEGTAGVSNDYIVRGISLNNHEFNTTVGGTVSLNNFYVNATANTVNLYDARYELKPSVGYKNSYGILSYDANLAYYFYPSAAKTKLQKNSYEYGELSVGAALDLHPVTLKGLVAYSPDYRFESGNAVYVEGGVDVKLIYDVTASGTFGRQFVQYNKNFAEDYNTYSVGLSRNFFGFDTSLKYVMNDINKNQCYVGKNLCDDRVLLTVSHKF